MPETKESRKKLYSFKENEAKFLEVFNKNDRSSFQDLVQIFQKHNLEVYIITKYFSSNSMDETDYSNSLGIACTGEPDKLSMLVKMLDSYSGSTLVTSNSQFNIGKTKKSRAEIEASAIFNFDKQKGLLGLLFTGFDIEVYLLTKEQLARASQ